MSQTFVSYSRRDVETVNKFVDAMTRAGLNIWIDREDIKAGNSWRVQIVEAIDTCDAFILMLSANSAASINVHKEVILAADSGRTIFLVMLEPVKIPAEIRYQLAGLQFVDVQALGFDKAAGQLVEAVNEHLKKIKPKGEETHKQVELVIQGIDLSAFTAEKQEQLLAFVASLADTDTSQLRIANMTAGSVHVFMDMPASAAFQLKALALNGNPRFAQQNIVALRINGNKLYVHTANGAPSPLPKASPIKNFFSSVVGRFLTLLAILIILAVLTTFNPPRATPVASDPTATWSSTPSIPAPTDSPSATATATQTPTQISIPTDTPTPTNTPVVYQVLNGVVTNERIACNYGPGDLYLNDEALRRGIRLIVLGRDINSGWAYVQADGYQQPCWVNLEYIEMDGGVDNLEPLYPGKVTLPRSDFWPPPQNVYTARSRSDPDKLSIYWDEFILQPGDMESANAPRYLLELWLCKGGELVFTPVFAWNNNVVVDDEAGCAEPSSGVIYLSEKHGYPGPVIIPWTAHPAP